MAREKLDGEAGKWTNPKGLPLILRSDGQVVLQRTTEGDQLMMPLHRDWNGLQFGIPPGQESTAGFRALIEFGRTVHCFKVQKRAEVWIFSFELDGGWFLENLRPEDVHDLVA